MARLDGVQVKVVAPVPYFPWKGDAFKSYSVFARVPPSEVRSNIYITHPKYPVIPKIGMTISPLSLAVFTKLHLQRIQASGFDFDLIDGYYMYPDGVASVILGLMLGKPVPLTALGSDVSLLSTYKLPRAAIVWAARRSGHVTAVCKALKDGLTRIGVAADHVRVILHGVDLQLFQPACDRVALRRRLGLDCPTLISVGHLIARKGHDIAIRAMSLLAGHRLLVVGDGPEERKLRRLTRDLDLEARVIFLGHVPQSELPLLLGAADALVNCSDREGIANVLLEAMACGTPVAATPIWGSPEVVSSVDAGILFRERSVGAVVEGVCRLLSHPPDRAMTRRHAERFSWRDTAVQHVETIQGVLEAWRKVTH